MKKEKYLSPNSAAIYLEAKEGVMQGMSAGGELENFEGDSINGSLFKDEILPTL